MTQGARRFWPAILVAGLFVSGCIFPKGGTKTPAPEPEPGPARHVLTVNTGEAGTRLVIQDGPNAGRSETTGGDGLAVMPALEQSGFTICVTGRMFPARAKVGSKVLDQPAFLDVQPFCYGVTLTRSQELQITMPAVELVPVEQFPTARRGVVRLNGRAFQDDEGTFLGVGLTFFAAGWAYKHDRARLEENLADIAKAGAFDYIRVLGVVGPDTGGWEDRTMDPRWSDYRAVIVGLTDLAYDRYGLRVQWSIFGGVDSVPTPGDRLNLVDLFADAMQGRDHKVMAYEVANEHWQNGFGGNDGRDELHRLAQRLKSQVPNLVALSATEEGREGWLYADSRADLFTIHLDRNVTGEGGMWRPVRQAWEVQFIDGIPRAWTSNEPIGPQSSVVADADTWRMVMSPAVVWVAGGAGYVFHTGPGVRFGGVNDLARGRVANFRDVENWKAITAGFRALRQSLPSDLPNWRPQNGNPRFPDYPFDTELMASQVEAGVVLRAFCTIGGERFVCAPIKVDRATQFKAKASMRLEVVNPLTGLVRETVSLTSGQTWTLQPTEPAAILRGQWVASEQPPTPTPTPTPTPPAEPEPIDAYEHLSHVEVAGGWYCDARARAAGQAKTTGEWVCLLIDGQTPVGVTTHAGQLPATPGGHGLPLFPRISPVGPFRFVGTAHFSDDVLVWNGGAWEVIPAADGRPCGVSAAIYDLQGQLHIAGCGDPTGSQGLRYAVPGDCQHGQCLVTGDKTYLPPPDGRFRLFEWTALADDLVIGQGPESGAVVWDRGVYRSLSAGNVRTIRANRQGDEVGVAMWRIGRPSLVLWATVAELRALPALK